METEYRLSRPETIKLISEAYQTGFHKGLESAGLKKKYVSKNQAYKLFNKSRVNNWINDGLITMKPNGNGKTSTVFLEYAKLQELDSSDRIVIRKSYQRNEKDN
jgi:predicted ABC-type ATPase